MGKVRLIDANALLDAPPQEMKIFIQGGRTIGKTAAIFEQLFRERVNAAPTVTARPVTKVRAVVYVDWAEEIYLKDPERFIMKEIAQKLGERMLEEGLVEIRRNENPCLLGRTEFECIAFVGYDELREEEKLCPADPIGR